MNAHDIIRRYGWNTMSSQLLAPGIRHWFSPDRDAMVGYVETSSHIVIAGSPVASDADLGDVTEQFLRFVRRSGKSPIVFGAQDRLLSEWPVNEIVSRVLIGMQPVWHPEELSERFRSVRSLRAQVHRAVNKGITVRRATTMDATLQRAMEQCRRSWLQQHPMTELHFLVESTIPAQCDGRIILLGERDDEAIAGYCIAVPIPMRKGWLIEHLVRSAEAPNGITELLVQRMAEMLRSEGAEFVTLGLSPLSEPTLRSATGPWWTTALFRGMRLFGERWYHFRGLERFKEKFRPARREPVYLLAGAPEITPAVFHAVAAAFLGVTPGAFLRRQLMRPFLP